MSEHLLERSLHIPTPAHYRRRQSRLADDSLVLTELDPGEVIDHLEPPCDPVDLVTFGTVREICPRCQHAQLKLVLRQRRVRLAHLFCSDCLGCYDAHYASGAPALTI